MIDVKKLNDILINLNSGNENHTNADHIIYITRANLINMRIIAGNVKDYVRSMETGPGAGGGSLSGISTKTTVQHHIYYIPFHTIICEQILEDEQVLEHISTIGEYSLGLVPLDSDILSLEMPDMFKQCYVDGDTSALNAVAQSLHKLQTTFGLINNIKAKGAASKKVIQKLLHLRREVTQNHVNNSNIANNSADDTANKTNLSQGNNAVYPPIHHIDTVVVLDREVDLVSALTTPLTYEV